MPSKFTINPIWPQFAGACTIAIALLAGALRYVLVDIGDPLRCNALLNSGSWLDSVHRNWQPEGCMLHPYGQKDGEICLESRGVVFVGDSVTRGLFFQFAHILDSSLPTIPPSNDKKHRDYELRTASGSRLAFFWDPFLNGTYIANALTTTRSNATADPPALLVLGSGLWYLRYAINSGGLPAWEANVENIFNKVSTASRRIADSIVILPVELLVPSKLAPERAETMHPSDIDAMNSDLFHRFAQGTPVSSSSPFASPVYLPLVFNDMLDPFATEDGIHYADALVQKQANILLNLQCNDVLPKHYPFSKTCCSRYPWPNVIHTLLLAIIIISVPVLCVNAKSDLRSSVLTAVGSPSVLPWLIMSCGLILIYLSDRSWLWLKEQKQFNAWAFAFLCLSVLLTGLATLKRADKDLGFLNRDQTDEWKGWMQLIILIYHYLGASKISGIYNPIRVLVASYLFMTGYGHTTFYLRKADFGFKRVAQVLIRLNSLTIFLAYVMDTDYISYYFSPLVSMWFLIIYATLAIGSQLNGRTPTLLLKVMLSAALTTSFMWQPQVLETLFAFLDRVFGIRWSAHEWSFRVNLDLWIVYAGMLTSIFVIKAREFRLTDHRLWPLTSKIAIGGSILVLIWFFVFELCQDSKLTYNRWHPYISFLPVLAFAILRNASGILRSASSSAFAFIGKCSLETFIIQYHFWLAGDTKGVLIVLPGTRWRPVNFVLTSIMFLYLSDRMAYATTQITTQICSLGQPPASLPNPVSTEPSNRMDRDSDHGQEVELPLRASHDLSAKEGNLIEPDTPVRPRRWIDRLSEQQSSVPSSLSSGLFGGLKRRIFFALLVMWVVNVLWSYA